MRSAYSRASLVALALASVLVAPASATTPRPASSTAAAVRIEVTAEGVTSDLVNAKAQDVLTAIAERARVRVMTAGAVDGELTARWRAVPLEQALRRLLAPADLVFLYALDGLSPGAAPRLVEVRVYGAADRSRPRDEVTHRDGSEARDVDGTPVEANDTDAARILEESDDHRARLRAVQALGRRDDERSIDAFARAAQDEDPGVRERAVKALARTWEERAVGTLMGVLLDDRDADVREAAARALGTFWTTAAAEALGAALVNDRSRSVREAAAEGLAVLGDPDTVLPLIAALRDSDSAIRERAAEALGSLGNPAALGALLDVASHDGDPWVRDRATQSVAALARRTAR